MTVKIATAWLRRWIPSTFILFILTGCASVSPQYVTTDRMNYEDVIGDSWKHQTLLNVVRLRYADVPVFLDVSSIINSYTIGSNANVGAALSSNTNSTPNIFQLGATGSWSNTPTVTYQPLNGDQFTKSLLQPVPPTAILQLLQGGWPANLVLPTVTASINGLRNSFAGIAAEPGFDELAVALTRIQLDGSLGLRIEPRKDGTAAVMVIQRNDVNSSILSTDRHRVRELLKLDENISEFEVTYGLVPGDHNEVAILSRSMLEIMLQLGFGIDLPANHVKDGRALPGQWKSGDTVAKPLVRIHSGKERPTDAYAAVPYRGYWYWIEDTDIASKRIFTFLMILFSLAETGQISASPIVTVPSR